MTTIAGLATLTNATHDSSSGRLFPPQPGSLISSHKLHNLFTGFLYHLFLKTKPNCQCATDIPFLRLMENVYKYSTSSQPITQLRELPGAGSCRLITSIPLYNIYFEETWLWMLRFLSVASSKQKQAARREEKWLWLLQGNFQNKDQKQSLELVGSPPEQHSLVVVDTCVQMGDVLAKARAIVLVKCHWHRKELWEGQLLMCDPNLPMLHELCKRNICCSGFHIAEVMSEGA